MRFRKILSALGQVYPAGLLLLASLPLLLGYGYKPELVEGREWAIVLAWIPVFTLPSLYFRRRIFYYVGCVLFFFAGVLEIAHWVILQGPITITSLVAIVNTTSSESMEFMQLRAGKGLLLLLPYTGVFLFSLRSTISYQKKPMERIIFVLTAIYSLVFIGENAWNQRLVRKGVPHIAKVGGALYDQMQAFAEVIKEVHPTPVKATAAWKGQQVFVLILGESCSRNHMSLYGYRRTTNPKLGARPDLWVFEDVVAPYSNTMSSVLTILSDASLDHPKPIQERIDVLDVMHAAGFKTYWISNQSSIGIWDNMIALFAKKADVTQFVNTTGNSSFESTYTISYDEKLLPPLVKALKDPAAKKFIVLHLMGNHMAYAKRYPKAYAVFEGREGKEKIIAQYDNSMRYNDAVVDSLFTVLQTYARENSTQAVSALYVSDHGENLWDEGEHVGHDYSGVLPHANVEIPFILWHSEGWESAFPGRDSVLKARLDAPYVTDDLFHTLIDLNAVKTPIFDRTKSIVHPSLDRSRRRVLEDGRDYDAR